MKKTVLLFIILLISVFLIGQFFDLHRFYLMSGAPPYGESEGETPSLDPYAWLRNWNRPAGPPKVGLQAGHWKNDELPEEFGRLRGSTGSAGGGRSEWEVN